MADHTTDSYTLREMESVAARRGDAGDVLRPEPLPPPRHQSRWIRAWLRAASFLALGAYYALLVGSVILLSSRFPAVREAFFTPVVLPDISREDATATLTGAASATVVVAEADTLMGALGRAIRTLWVILGSLLLVVPVAWVYMQAKRLRYDPALVRSIVILPIVVAGIAMVVKNSVALAFALAGIVAAVRFRNTLKDPRDAVYIFLVIGIGLASGVQALDVALVMSMVFNFVVLTLWRFNIGSIYGSGYGRTGVLSTGEPGLLVAQVPAVRKQIRRSLIADAEDLDSDGVLLVHTDDIELARHTVQEALSEMAKEWEMVRIAPRDHRLFTLEYLVQLKKKASPADLVGELDERWGAQVLAAEYFPFRVRASTKDDDDEEDDD